jgi:hypothetical protein
MKKTDGTGLSSGKVLVRQNDSSAKTWRTESYQIRPDKIYNSESFRVHRIPADLRFLDQQPGGDEKDN